MKIIVVSARYPPDVVGGYEVECSAVVERLAQHHEVTVLTCQARAPETGEGYPVLRQLPVLSEDERGALRAPWAALEAVRVARGLLAQGPDLIYAWNGASLPQSTLRVFADSHVPLAFRVCEHWFGRIFAGDQFLRELLPGRRSPARQAWSLGCRAIDALPQMRLRPLAPFRAAVSWNSQAIRQMAGTPAYVQVVMERIEHSVPRHGERYAAVERSPCEVPEILFLGRVTPYKGISVAVEALALLHERLDVRPRLVVLGPSDPDHEAELRRRAEVPGIADSIEWRGQGGAAEVAGALERAHVLIVPSVWQEPFPLVTIEGALARVPLVASDVGGIGEGMHDEEHALLFAGGDAQGAARALARVLKEPEQTAARVERALARAQKFLLAPYLDAQERFVSDAHAALLR